jgi:hypothetical protein
LFTASALHVMNCVSCVAALLDEVSPSNVWIEAHSAMRPVWPELRNAATFPMAAIMFGGGDALVSVVGIAPLGVIAPVSVS